MCIWCILTDKTHFLETKSHKLRSKAFCSCLLKKISNEKTLIVNKNILNKSKDFCFVLVFFQRKHTCIFICIICECRFLESYIQCQWNKNLFNLQKNIVFKKKIKKYCYSLFFTNSIAFTFNKRPNLHLVKLFYKNCSYTTGTACLYSVSSSFQYLLLSKLFQLKKQASYWYRSKNKVRNAENVELLATFEYFHYILAYKQ